ncbi:SOS response-associated peptidase family protein, partial [Pseudomonas syringae]|uniref:SOS response-associated peptidase family protein n=9 Tax=Pseudomonas syringae TaxID=317 RepID=UPI00215F13EC
MCGRYSIYESMDHYLRELAPEQLVINGYDLCPIERYNVAPSTRVELIRPTQEGLSVDKVRWGWEPFWAKGGVFQGSCRVNRLTMLLFSQRFALDPGLTARCR